MFKGAPASIHEAGACALISTLIEIYKKLTQCMGDRVQVTTRVIAVRNSFAIHHSNKYGLIQVYVCASHLLLLHTSHSIQHLFL